MCRGEAGCCARAGLESPNSPKQAAMEMKANAKLRLLTGSPCLRVARLTQGGPDEVAEQHRELAALSARAGC